MQQTKLNPSFSYCHTLEFFANGDINGIEPLSNVEQPSQEIEPLSNVEQPSQESRLNPRRESQPQGSVTHQEASVGAGTSVQGHARRMTRVMAELVSQQNFYRQSQIHYMASSATDFVTGQTNEDCKHNEHLALQECMRHPIAFHAYVGYHTRKITLPVIPLTVLVMLPIPVM